MWKHQGQYRSALPAACQLQFTADQFGALSQALYAATQGGRFEIEATAVVFDSDLNIPLPVARRYAYLGSVCMFDYIRKCLLNDAQKVQGMRGFQPAQFEYQRGQVSIDM